MGTERKHQLKTEGKSESPLRWPSGWPRTRIQDRKPQSQWKKPLHVYQQLLIAELGRLKATSYLITTNSGSDGQRDPGASVFFSLKPLDIYGWQEALGFIGEIPTIQQIDHAYLERAKKVHPDGPTPDVELFRKLTLHRDNAKSWVRGEHLQEHDKVMACDAFNDVRLNLNAVRLTLAAMRQIERCGASVMLERAFRGFNKMITAGSGE
jgi:hypothetical protein